MKRLLIVWHTQFGCTAALARAAIEGARGVDGVETIALRAHDDRLAAAARDTPSSRFALLLVALDRFGALNAMLGLEGGDVGVRVAAPSRAAIAAGAPAPPVPSGWRRLAAWAT